MHSSCEPEVRETLAPGQPFGRGGNKLTRGSEIESERVRVLRQALGLETHVLSFHRVLNRRRHIRRDCMIQCKHVRNHSLPGILCAVLLRGCVKCCRVDIRLQRQ